MLSSGVLSIYKLEQGELGMGISSAAGHSVIYLYGDIHWESGCIHMRVSSGKLA